MKNRHFILAILSSLLVSQAQAQKLDLRNLFRPDVDRARQQAGATVSTVSGYDAALVRKVQSALLRLGYRPGPADGMMGLKTERAIREFQRDSGLPPTGVPSSALLSRLNAGTMESQPADRTPRPSFDCARAGTVVEHLICSSVALADKDRRIAALYSEALAKSGTPGDVRARQRAWIEERDRCGASERCLAQSMDTRIAELQDTSMQASRRGSGDPANASYSRTVNSGIVMSAGEAAAAHCDTSKEVCFKPIEVENTLQLSRTPNGDLKFDVFINGFNGHSCGLQGLAKKAATSDLWHYEAFEYGALCKFDIKIGAEAVAIEQDDGSDCSAYCGARAYLGGEFPISSMTRR